MRTKLFSIMKNRSSYVDSNDNDYHLESQRLLIIPRYPSNNRCSYADFKLLNTED